MAEGLSGEVEEDAQRLNDSSQPLMTLYERESLSSLARIFITKKSFGNGGSLGVFVWTFVEKYHPTILQAAQQS